MSDERSLTLLNRNKAAAFLGMSVSSFDALRNQPDFPNPIILLNASKWLQGDLEGYIEERRATSNPTTE